MTMTDTTAKHSKLSGDSTYQLLHGAYDFASGSTVWHVREYNPQRGVHGSSWDVTGRMFRFTAIKRVVVKDAEGNVATAYTVTRAGIVGDGVWSPSKVVQ